jgi:hypothetical protein
MVLGFFVYPDTGAKNIRDNNEIDIEFAKWGKDHVSAGNYTVTPDTYNFPFSLNGNYTMHQFTWKNDKQVLFQSFHGHVADKSLELSSWLYSSEDNMRPLTGPPVRVHMNFWLYMANPPSDEKEQEIVISNFVFIPADLLNRID